MTTPRRRKAISRGRRFGSVDYTLLSIPTVGFLALLVPLILHLFYYGPMTTQDGDFTVVDCTRSSAESDEASYMCSGEFTPNDGSDPITRLPHWYSAEGKILEPGDTIAMTLYENDLLVREGSSPMIYSIMYIAGGSFACVGVFILWAYVARWFARKEPDQDAPAPTGSDPDLVPATPARGSAADDPAPTDIDTSRKPSRLTGLPIQANGWDAEPPEERRGRVGLVVVMLAVSLLGTVIGFGSAVGAEVQRSAIPHTLGAVTISTCTVDMDLDIGSRYPSIYCEGAFVATATDEPETYRAADRIGFEPHSHKVYSPGETVPVKAYQDGAVRDSSGPDPRAVPGIAWGLTLSFTSILLGGVVWLSRSATH
jgi:hypothetical protein